MGWNLNAQALEALEMANNNTYTEKNLIEEKNVKKLIISEVS